jgi:UL92 family
MLQHQIQLWHLIRQPFRLPARIHHCALRDWESIDCDVAGCLLCGKIHECKDAMECPLVVYEGRHVCEITGFYTRRNVFVDDEFVDTAASVSTCPGRIIQKIPPSLVETWVDRILCSDLTTKSIQQEIIKRKHRLKLCFIRCAKVKKASQAPLNILDLCTQVAHITSQIRMPRIMSTLQK